jgi:hypothetical protein
MARRAAVPTVPRFGTSAVRALLADRMPDAALCAEARLGARTIADAAAASDAAATNRIRLAGLEVRLLRSMYLPVS